MINGFGGQVVIVGMTRKSPEGMEGGEVTRAKFGMNWPKQRGESEQIVM